MEQRDVEVPVVADDEEFITTCRQCGEESEADVCDDCYDRWFDGDIGADYY